jgi:hypothetical protein
MQVKIIRSGKPTYWYNDKIGEVFDVIYNGNIECYELPDGLVIFYDDAEEVTRHTNFPT